MDIEMVGTAAAQRESDPGCVEDLIRSGAHRDAVARCARDHGRALGSLCMALLGVQAEAEEAAQDTLLAAHDAMSSYRGDGTVRAWLFGIARRICARRLETRTRRDRRLRLVQGDEPGRLPDEQLAVRRRAERVRAALESLRPSERETLLLRYEAGLTFREMSVVYAENETALRKRASRALRRLAEILGEGVER
jgi:RNA polymerase sigma-70 factor (ECF subfamily)